VQVEMPGCGVKEHDTRMMMDLPCTAGAVARLRPSARGLAVSRAVDSVTTGRRLCAPIVRNSTPPPCSGWCSVVVGRGRSPCSAIPTSGQSIRWHTTAPEAIPAVGYWVGAVRAAELSKGRPRSDAAARRCCVTSDLEAIDGNQDYASPEVDLAGLTRVVIWRSVQRCLRYCLSLQRPANTWRAA
jgi:hypothetical protein